MLQQMNDFFYGNGNWRYTLTALIVLLLLYFIPKLRVFFKSVGENNKRKIAEK